MNDVAAFYAEQWLHEHRGELPDEVVEYIEGLQTERDEAVREAQYLQELFDQEPEPD